MIPRVLPLIVCACLTASAQKGKPFELPCSVPQPLRGIGAEPAIDGKCGILGGSAAQDKQLESQAKNDFCAKGEPITITTATLKQLQAKSDGIEGLRGQLKESRDSVRDILKLQGKSIGEGTLVRMVAYLNEAHVSNVSKGEAVNCNVGGKDNNDIHIVLTASPQEDDMCNSFTAEMSPHFRPDEWLNLTSLSLGRRPIRVTGPLFYDGSHTPCRSGKKASPMRASVWEIHPVYAFDICRFANKTRCKAEDDEVWVPLHEKHADEKAEQE